MNEYCTNCRQDRPVNEKPTFLSTVLMTCKHCGHWVKCRHCMAIKSTTHQCAGERDVAIPG